MSVQEYYKKDYVHRTFTMVSPLERVIIRRTPPKHWNMLRRSDLNTNEDFMELINQHKLTNGDYASTRAIELDDPTIPLSRLLYAIGYNEKEETAELSREWCYFHIYINVNLCLAHKARKVLNSFINHPFIRDCIKEMFEMPDYYKITSKSNMFEYIDPSHSIFDDLFINDTTFMDIIVKNPIAKCDFFETFVYACIRGRHYKGIERLVELDSELTITMLHSLLSIRWYKPDGEFLKLCLSGYHCWRFINRYNDRVITMEKILIPCNIKKLFFKYMDEPDMGMFIANACRHGLTNEMLALLHNRFYNDETGELIRKITGWEIPFDDSDIKPNVYLSDEEIDVLFSALKEDKPETVLSLFECETDMIKERLDEVFILAIKYRAHRCIKAMLLRPDMKDALDDIIIHGRFAQLPEDAYRYYGSIKELETQSWELCRRMQYIPLMHACNDSSTVSLLYRLNDTISDISDNNFNAFRYTITVGAIVHFNNELYEWAIDTLYNASEEDFIYDIYLHEATPTSSIMIRENSPIIRALEAFLLYRKCLEYTLEEDL